MKKSFLLLALLGAFAGTAAAQSSVTVYGAIDLGLVHESGGAGGSVAKLSSGVEAGSRLGFKGTEDLGGGLSAHFQLENGLAADTGGFNQGGLLFGRQAYVGLKGNFGTVNFGRQYLPLYNAFADADPFGAGLAGSAGNLFPYPARMDNTILYMTPAMGGFTGEFAYGLGEVAGNASANRHLDLTVGYQNGPLAVKLAHHNIRNATDTNTTKYNLVTGVYNFGPAKLHLAYGTNRDDATLDANDILLGVSAPVGGGTVMASYVRKNDKSAANMDANQAGIGYTYPLSKRTNVYTAYGRINNDNGAAYTVGNAIEGGSGDKAFNVGIRHKF